MQITFDIQMEKPTRLHTHMMKTLSEPARRSVDYATTNDGCRVAVDQEHQFELMEVLATFDALDVEGIAQRLLVGQAGPDMVDLTDSEKEHVLASCMQTLRARSGLGIPKMDIDLRTFENGASKESSVHPSQRFVG